MPTEKDLEELVNRLFASREEESNVELDLSALTDAERRLSGNVSVRDTSDPRVKIVNDNTGSLQGTIAATMMLSKIDDPEKLKYIISYLLSLVASFLGNMPFVGGTSMVKAISEQYRDGSDLQTDDNRQSNIEAAELVDQFLEHIYPMIRKHSATNTPAPLCNLTIQPAGVFNMLQALGVLPVEHTPKAEQDFGSALASAVCLINKTSGGEMTEEEEHKLAASCVRLVEQYFKHTESGKISLFNSIGEPVKTNLPLRMPVIPLSAAIAALSLGELDTGNDGPRDETKPSGQRHH